MSAGPAAGPAPARSRAAPAGRLQALDGMRGILALVVVAQHALQLSGLGDIQWAASIAVLGLALVLPVAWLLWRGVEQPSMRWSRRLGAWRIDRFRRPPRGAARWPPGFARFR